MFFTSQMLLNSIPPQAPYFEDVELQGLPEALLSLEKYGNLRFLSIAGSESLSQWSSGISQILNLLAKIPTLTTLGIAVFAKCEIENPTRLPHLGTLSVRGEVTSIASLLSALDAPNLHTLSVCFAECQGLDIVLSTDLEMLNISSIHPHLRSLAGHFSTNKVHEVEPLSVILGPFIELRELEELDIFIGDVKVAWIDDHMKRVIKCWPNLRRLVIEIFPCEVCPTAQTLQHIAQDMPCLETLSLPTIRLNEPLPKLNIGPEKNLRQLTIRCHPSVLDHSLTGRFAEYIDALFPNMTIPRGMYDSPRMWEHLSKISYGWGNILWMIDELRWSRKKTEKTQNV